MWKRRRYIQESEGLASFRPRSYLFKVHPIHEKGLFWHKTPPVEMIKSGTQCKVGKCHSQWCLYLALFILKLIKLSISILHVFCGVYLLMIVYELARTKTCSTALDLPKSAGCNRETRLCDRRYNQISFATIHNAFALTLNPKP